MSLDTVSLDAADYEAIPFPYQGLWDAGTASLARGRHLVAVGGGVQAKVRIPPTNLAERVGQVGGVVEGHTKKLVYD